MFSEQATVVDLPVAESENTQEIDSLRLDESNQNISVLPNRSKRNLSIQYSIHTTYNNPDNCTFNQSRNVEEHTITQMYYFKKKYRF